MKVFCFLFGHKYKVFRKVNKYIQEIECKRCGKEWAINHDVKVILPLDDELIECHNNIILDYKNI